MTTNIARISTTIQIPPEPANLVNRGLIIDLGFTNLPVWDASNNVPLTFVPTKGQIDGLFNNSTANVTRDLLTQFFAENTTNGVFVLNFGAYNGGSTETSGYFIGNPVAAGFVTDIEAITDGSFSVTIDGTTQNITGLDFTGVTGNVEILDIINAELTGAVASLTSNNSLKITSTSVGSISTVSALSPEGTGTDISEVGFLNAQTGTSVDGIPNINASLDLILQFLQSPEFSGDPVFLILLPDQLYAAPGLNQFVALFNSSASALFFIMNSLDFNPGTGTGPIYDTFDGFAAIAFTYTIPGTPSVALNQFAKTIDQLPFPNPLQPIINQPSFTCKPFSNAIQQIMEGANIGYVDRRKGYPKGIGYVSNPVCRDGIDIKVKYAIYQIADSMQAGLTTSIVENAQNRINPYQYDQGGINNQRGTLISVCSSANTAGYTPTDPSVSQSAVQAIPFAQYVANFPKDYTREVYNGFSVTLQYPSFIGAVGVAYMATYKVVASATSATVTVA